MIEAFKEDVRCALGEVEQPELETVLQKVYKPFEDIVRDDLLIIYNIFQEAEEIPFGSPYFETSL